MQLHHKATYLWASRKMTGKLSLNGISKRHWEQQYVVHSPYICSAQPGNLRNLEIALHILGIPRLRNTCVQSQDCVTHVHNLEIAQTTCAQSQDPRATVRQTASDLSY